jgi:hypothetical protein
MRYRKGMCFAGKKDSPVQPGLLHRLSLTHCSSCIRWPLRNREFVTCVLVKKATASISSSSTASVLYCTHFVSCVHCLLRRCEA